MIAVLLKRSKNNIKKVKLRFRKHVKGFTPGLDGTQAYLRLLKLQKEQRKQKGLQKRLYSRYVKNHPYKPTSQTIKWSRHQFIDVEDMKQNIVANHNNQKERYWFDIQFGNILRNVETCEHVQFYPSGNTSFFNVGEHPLVNDSIHAILEQIEGDNIVDKLKRPNSKWTIERICEYVILTTPLQGMPIGSAIKLPDYIMNSKSIISFDGVGNNLCFWYCLAHHK